MPVAAHPPPPDADRVAEVQRLLLDWWDAGHRDLPWRRTSDPYAILVSEVMLQQTQAARVAPKYERFMERFPDLRSLAAAPVAEVIRVWAGLGYNRRAVNLQRAARAAIDEHDGALPRTAAGLQTLPGIGPYTARAVAAIAGGEPVAAVDTNVRRVLTRVVDGPDSRRTPAALQSLADAMLVAERPGDWTQALMELGALVCLPAPRCAVCPLRTACCTAPAAATIRERRAAYRATPSAPRERFQHSTRFYRGRIVDLLRSEPADTHLNLETIGVRLRLDYGPADRPWLEALIDGLARDGLVVRDGERVSLPPG